MEAHAMERASWATFFAASLAQRSGLPVPTKTLPIGTERRDIYACENGRGNQKSSSLGKIQISYQSTWFHCTLSFVTFSYNDQHWLAWVDVREWWSSIRKSDQCLSVWTIAALGTHPDSMSIPLVNHSVEKVKVKKRMQWNSKVRKPILLVAHEKVKVKVYIRCTVWWQ